MLYGMTPADISHSYLMGNELTCSWHVHQPSLVLRSDAGAKHVVVMDGAYHGHTTATIDLSPYKFNGPGGSGRCSELLMRLLEKHRIHST